MTATLSLQPIQQNKCGPIGFGRIGGNFFTEFTLGQAEGLFFPLALKVVAVETGHELLGGTVAHLPKPSFSISINL